MIIVRVFAGRPAIKRLVHHNEAHLVAQIQQLRSRRIVARADGVDAGLAQNFQLPLQRADVDGRAERAEIVVVANAVQLDVLAVKKKSFVHGELRSADAKRRFVNIHGASVLFHRGHDDIALRLFQAPEFG